MCPHFDYECSKCGGVQEEFHGMLESRAVHCDICRGACVKLIGCGAGVIGMNAGRATHDFVDYNTTGKPIRIHNKRQWNEHLKRHGLHDDVSNSPMRIDQLQDGMKVDKQKMKRETKEAIVRAVKDKRYIREMKQKSLREGGL